MMSIIAKKQSAYYTGITTVDPHLKSAYEALYNMFNEKYHQHLDKAFGELSHVVEMLQEEKINDDYADNPKANMNSLFGCEDWKELSNIEDAEKRAEEVIKLYTERLQAEYTTWIRMIGEHRELKYVLIHASHAPKAKQLMKQAIWSTLPSGEFTAYQSDNPYQGLLIKPEPDLSPLEDRVWEVCTGRQIYYEELLKEINLIETIYLEKHLNEILRRLKNEKIIDASGYERRFAFRENPLFEFPLFRP